MTSLYLYLITFIAITGVVNTQQDIAINYLSGMTDACIGCLCEASTGCDKNKGCEKGFCGPFRLSRGNWIDAGKVVLENADSSEAQAFSDCARNYPCAQKIIRGLMAKFGRDCNNDGVTNCDDYAMVHFNGGHDCTVSISRSDAGRLYLSRFESCKANL